MKNLLLILILLSLPVYATNFDKYGIPYCKSKQEYNCRVKNNSQDNLIWYQVIEQRWNDNGTELINDIIKKGFELPYQSYNQLCYDYKVKTTKEANNEIEEELKLRKKEQEEYENKKQEVIIKNKQQPINDYLTKFTINNNKKPARQFTTQEKNFQYGQDFCLNNTLKCIEDAYAFAISGGYGQKLFNGQLDIAGQQKLYNEIFWFYTITYRQRWKNGYYVEANPCLWQYGRPN